VVKSLRFPSSSLGWLKNIYAAVMPVIYMIPAIMDEINIDIIDDYFHDV